MVVQLVELPGDGGDRTRLEVHDRGPGQEGIRQRVEYDAVALALFDVALDGASHAITRPKSRLHEIGGGLRPWSTPLPPSKG